jgi:hypothetical protein
MSRAGTHVKTLIRELCLQSIRTVPGGDARAIAERALELYPEECQALLRFSLIDYLTDMARDVFKGLQEAPTDNGQMLLPGFPKSHAALLPVAIAVPRKGRTMAYKALFGPHAASQSELQAGIEALRKQIACDIARCEALEELWKYREYRGESPDERIA